jgi:hypothetical protein
MAQILVEPPPRAAVDPGLTPEFLIMSEAEWQEWVVERARQGGWLIHSIPKVPTDEYGNRESDWWTPTRGHTGWPDLACSRPGQLVFAELKSEKGRKEYEAGRRPEQRRWLESLGTIRSQAVGTFLWSPRDVLEVQRVLA